MATNQSQSPSTSSTPPTLDARVARIEGVILELLEVLDKLASGLPALGPVASAKAKVKDMLARFRGGR